MLYWCARNMSFWSSISFNLAVLMNLLVAFFYPFRGVRGGTCLRAHGDPGKRGGEAATCAPALTPGSTQTTDGAAGTPQTREVSLSAG